MEKPLLNQQKIRVRDRPPGSPRSIFAQFQDQRNTAAMLVGRTLLATGATGVKQGVKQGESLLGGQRGTRTRMRSIYTACLVYHYVKQR